MSVGWYSIAYLPDSTLGQPRGSGLFTLSDRTSGQHQTVWFLASSHYANQDSITVLFDGSYNTTGPYRYLRIMGGSTYQGAVLQVYVDFVHSTGNEYFSIDLIFDPQDDGWTTLPFIPEADPIPEVPNYPTFTEQCIVDLDDSNQNQTAIISTGGAVFADDLTLQETPSQPSSTADVNLGKGTSGNLQVYTANGYVSIGPQNSGYCHLYTDRARFYFNKRIIVDEGIISAYNDDLILATDNASYTHLTINSGATTNVGVGVSPDLGATLNVGGLIRQTETAGFMMADVNGYLTSANVVVPGFGTPVVLPDSYGPPQTPFGWLLVDIGGSPYQIALWQ